VSKVSGDAMLARHSAAILGPYRNSISAVINASHCLAKIIFSITLDENDET
jgi:hypothetical protein